jgi:hypothetical protein
LHQSTTGKAGNCQRPVVIKTVLFLQRLTVTPRLAEDLIQRISDPSGQLGRSLPRRELDGPSSSSSSSYTSSPWVKFSLSECPENDPLHQVVDVAAANFSCIVLADLPQMHGTRLVRSLATAGLQSNGGLQRLEFREVTLSADQAAVLGSEGLAHTASLRELVFGTVTFTGGEGRDDDAAPPGGSGGRGGDALQRLAEGLGANRSLQKLHMVRCRLRDGQVAVVADSLCHHPRLTELDLSGNHCRRMGLRALSNLLAAEDCHLRVLKLNDQFYKMATAAGHRRDEVDDGTHPAVVAETRDADDGNNRASGDKDCRVAHNPLRLEELLDGLQRNRSLATLELSRNELEDVDELLSVLWRCPKLRSLNLLGNRIARLQSWRRFWAQPWPTRLRQLELSYNPFHYCPPTRHGHEQQHQQHHRSDITQDHRPPGRETTTTTTTAQQREENAKWLLRLLEFHPELSSAGGKVAQSRGRSAATRGARIGRMGGTGRSPVPNQGGGSHPRSGGSRHDGDDDDDDEDAGHRSGGPALFWKDTSHGAKIQHFLDLNEMGRVLVASNAVPLSVWPHVLERANRQFAGARRANVIFHLLHGPMTELQ